MLILSAMATVIASQALISGAFSITEQAIALGTCPRMKVVHTSDTVRGQIYIPTLNWMLMIVCLILVTSFKSSTALSGAYGLAVCGDMTLTSIFFLSLARFKWRWNLIPWAALAIGFFVFDFSFLSSAILKVGEFFILELKIDS
jgi:KUP system potassium uptake protein